MQARNILFVKLDIVIGADEGCEKSPDHEDQSFVFVRIRIDFLTVFHTGQAQSQQSERIPAAEQFGDSMKYRMMCVGSLLQYVAIKTVPAGGLSQSQEMAYSCHIRHEGRMASAAG